jgi:putative FmdB family regulatory protein
MPIYEYRCPSCGNRFERLVRMGSVERPICPTCHAPAAERVVSTIARVGGACAPGGT